jgi:CrcB protein
MDDEPQDPPADHDRVARRRDAVERERETLAKADHDLLDEAVLPLFGLSTSTLLAIFVGGALGTLARYLLEAHHPAGPGAFPWVTLAVNLSGSLAIGVLIPLTEHVSHRAPLVRPLLVVGFLGGWTTYSTLAVDAALLARHGDVATSVGYLAATVFGGLALVVAGHDLGKRMVPA